MSTPPQVRLHLYHARDAARTVILRQGPTRLWRMILWDRDTDNFHDGQWLYFALDGQWSQPTRGSYTVISRPPFFTALRLYPQGDTWGGGGFFVDATRFCVTAWGKPAALRRSEDGLEQVFLTQPSPANPTGLTDHKDKPLRLPQATRDWLAQGRPAPVRDYVTEGPCLYRQTGTTRHLIRDLSDMAFAPVPAPYAPSAPWHPMDGEAR